MKKILSIFIGLLALTGCSVNEISLEDKITSIQSTISTEEVYIETLLISSTDDEVLYDRASSRIKTLLKDCNQLGGHCKSKYVVLSYTQAKEEYTQTIAETNKPPVKILEFVIGENKYNSKEFQITVENQSGKDIRYLKIDIFKKDSFGNIVDSVWTNWSGTFKSNATQVITKPARDYDSSYNYQASISEVNYKY